MALSVDRDTLNSAAHWEQMPSEAKALLRSLEAPWFPGAVFPARSEEGGLVFYAAASTPAEWRKLQPLLLAFAGPTLTDFEGAPRRLDPTKPVEHALLAARVTQATRLRPGRFPKGEQMALRGLLRLVTLLESAPDLATSRPEPTARLLAALQDALNAADTAEAWRIHNVLRDESRLEAINLLQLEMQILAAGNDWGAVRWHHRFETLALAEPSPATAEVMLEAIYWTTVYDASAGKERSSEQVFADSSFEIARLLLPVAPDAAKPAVQKLRDLLLPAASEIKTAAYPGVVIGHGDDVPEDTQARQRDTDATGSEPAGITEAENSSFLSSEQRSSVPLDPGTCVRAAFAKVAALPLGSAEADTNLLHAMALLSDDLRAELLRRPMNLAIWHEVLERAGQHRPPMDWSEWVDSLARADFDAIKVAAHGATAWRLGDEDIDPASARALAARIEAVPPGLAEERFGAAIPYLVQWVHSDPRWPRQGLCSLYLAILMRMALSARRGETALRSAARLLDGALQCGLTSSEYRDALDAAESICVEGLSRRSAYDALEIVEIVRSFSPTDPDHLLAFSLKVISVLAALANRLTNGQRLALNALAREAGVELGLGDNVAHHEVLATPDLSGKIIGIYTLTETAGRQAEAMLRAAIPGVVVDLNHDHGGSTALAAMVARSDLIVVAWASAKHAATEFIRARRGDRPLTYAAGKGATSIFRAVEEWATSSRRIAA